MQVSVFRFRSFSCLRTKSAKFWTLKGRAIRTGAGSLLGQVLVAVFNFRGDKRHDHIVGKVLWIFQPEENRYQTVTFFRKL